MALASRGMFPREVPPCFSSASLGLFLDLNCENISGFLDSNSVKSSDFGVHNLARVGKLRRKVAVVNPIHFLKLSDCIVQNWKEVECLCSGGHLSVTTPKISYLNSNRAIEPKKSFSERPPIKIKKRYGVRFVLKADILRFYPSIYTHSIEWAVVGKPEAKSNLDKSNAADERNLGQKLDRLSRCMQDRQTTGIPIGPDTSLVIAEILLASVDRDLRCKIGSLRGTRAIDDYELYFREKHEAEDALTVLQETLSKYNLDLNQSKTKILKLPCPVESTWPYRLKNFDFREGKLQKNDIITYFDIAFELSKKYEKESILKYAISRISRDNNIKISTHAWTTYQNLLLQCAVGEPGTQKYVLSELKKYKYHSLNRDKIQHTLESIISHHAPLGHGSEVVWALWIAIDLEIELPSHLRTILDIDDPLVPILALYAEERGLISNLDTSTLERIVDIENLYGENWLLSYESRIRGWLGLNPHGSFSNGCSRFQRMKKGSVRFLREPEDLDREETTSAAIGGYYH